MSKSTQYLSQFGVVPAVLSCLMVMIVFDKLKRKNPTNSCKQQTKLQLLLTFQH